jgi:SWI/SNF-related matrix-associated actin-dependent regulator of chromatin subfamily A-like protein 1
MMELFPYQQQGVELLLGHLKREGGARGALLADPPGAGKTPQAIHTAMQLGASRILVVCPASLKENWRREAIRWSGGEYSAVTLRSGKDVPAITEGNVVIISYDLACRPRMKDALLSEAWDMLIMDESHALKSPSSQRSRIIGVLLWNRARYRLCMTGTPLPNGRASEAWTTFSRLAPSVFGDWKSFCLRYCIPEETPWGVSYSRSKNLEELGRIAREHFMVRRKKEDVLQSLPELIRQTIPLEVPRMKVDEAEGGINIEEIVEAVEAGIPLMSDHISTARRKLGILKAGPALRLLTEVILEEVDSCVVFAHHREVLASLAGGLESAGVSYVSITGSTPTGERQSAVDAFQASGVRVFLASLTAANTGLTLTRSQTVVFVEADWVPSNNTQAEARIHRVTQTDICRALYLTVPDSLDEAVVRSVTRKSRDITKVMMDR